MSAGDRWWAVNLVPFMTSLCLERFEKLGGERSGSRGVAVS